MSDKSFTLEVFKIEGSDDLGIELPDDLMDRMGWQAGDTVVWTEQENGSWLLTVEKE